MCHKISMEFGKTHPKEKYVRGNSIDEVGILYFQFCCS